jgi:hypothetical protein
LLDIGDAVMATGIDGIYNLDAAGVTRFSPMPSFQQIGAIYISFDLPDVVLVLTGVNARNAVSPLVPMILRR